MPTRAKYPCEIRVCLSNEIMKKVIWISKDNQCSLSQTVRNIIENYFKLNSDQGWDSNNSKIRKVF
jgi:hypothetical protein